MKMQIFVLVTIILFSTFGFAQSSEPYQWNNQVPEKKPSPDNDNGKLILFDVSHGGTTGNSDWVIDGGFSDFADDLAKAGYTVREYRGVDKNNDGIIRFFDDRKTENIDKNEAIITYEAIKHANVFVLSETNRPFTLAEQEALKKFVDSGKGIFFISDHYNADRNLNTWDSTEVFNGYNRSDLAKYNLQGIYGDLRNPKSPYLGWLAENFGVRFRFNAIDCKSGVTDIVAPEESEGLTLGVKPLLIAAGGTVAITDYKMAKGIVYLGSNDPVKKWGHATDKGLYFGGRNEGPFVAISKPSNGKAAFIGDSSPIEDSSPRYEREDSGSRKKTHPGWKSKGTANVISLSIIKWLSTPESYVGFGSAEHPAGEVTPEPMATTEMTDPDNGKPWTQPSGSYDPWNTDTFAKGSYGAPFAKGGSGPIGGEISVSDFLTKANAQNVKVVGIISAELNKEFGLQLADENQLDKTISIKIPSHLRDTYSPRLNPSIVGTKVLISGSVGSYMGQKGIKSVSDIVKK